MAKIEKMGFNEPRVVFQWRNQPQNIGLSGRVFHFRSKFEATWAKYLQQLEDWGVIEKWDYEDMTFIFEGVERGAVQYTPDFYVKQDGEEFYQETKTHLVGKDITKFRRMSEHFPDVKLVLVMDRPKAKENHRLRSAARYCFRIVFANQVMKKSK